MIKRLIGLRLRAAFLSMTQGRRSKDGSYTRMSTGKLVLYVILYAYLGLVFAGMSAGISFVLGALFLPGSDWAYFGILLLAVFSILLLLSIFETKSELFECKDNALLMSMPIRPRQIVVSRIFVVLIYNYVEMALVALPMLFVYLILGHSVAHLFTAALVFAILPFPATALAAFFGYLLAELSKRMRNKTLVSVVLALGFFALYFVGYMKLMGSLESMEDMDTASVEALLEKLSFLRPLGECAAGKPLPLLLYILLSAAVTYVAYVLISRHYFSVITATVGTSRRAYRLNRGGGRSPFFALAGKELRRFFSSAAYILNAAISPLLGLGLAVFTLVRRQSMLGAIDSMMQEMEGLSGTPSSLLAPVFIIAAVFFAAMNLTASSAVSLEGNSLWIPRSMPLSERTVLLAKTVPHFLVGTPISLLTLFLLLAAVGAEWYYYPLGILTLLLANAAFALLGVVMNVAFPKFAYNNEAQVLKQSAAVGLSMLVQMVLDILLLVLTVPLSLFSLGIVALFVALILFAGMTVGLYFLLTGPCARRFSRF